MMRKIGIGAEITATFVPDKKTFVVGRIAPDKQEEMVSWCKLNFKGYWFTSAPHQGSTGTIFHMADDQDRTLFKVRWIDDFPDMYHPSMVLEKTDT